MKYKTIIFDFDGTIADTFNTIIDIVNKNKNKFGIDGIDPEEIPRLKGLEPRYLLREFNVHIFQIPSFVSFIRKELNKEMVNVKIFDGMHDVLMSLKDSNYRIGILTSNSVENVNQFLHRNNLEVFDFVQSEKSLFGKHKSLNKITRVYKLEKKEVLYVGDELRDLNASHKANIDVMSVTWGYNTKKLLEEHNPDYLVNKPEEILNILNDQKTDL